MRRKTALGLLATVALPVLATAASTALLRSQAGRLRREFDTAAPAPGAVLQISRAVVRPPLGDRLDDSASEVVGLGALAVIGDSWIAGSGEDDPPMLMARGLAALTGTTVHLSDCAAPSTRADQISAQVDRVLSDPHLTSASGLRIAVISMGTGDVVHPVTGSITLGVLTSALTRLERGGFATVVLCCPNLTTLPGVRNPLRTVIRRSSRVLAGSQWLAALAAGALPLSTTRILSGTTRVGLVDPSGQRPSRLGRRQLAAAVVSAVSTRLEAPSSSDPVPEPTVAAPATHEEEST